MKRGLLIALSVVLAAAGTALVALYVRSADQRATARATGEGDLVRVLVAAQDLPAGEVARTGWFTTAEYPRAIVPRTAVRVGQQDRVDGKRSQMAISQGVPIVTAMFGDQALSAAEMTFGGEVEKGNVVVPVRIDDAESLAGIVDAGSRVGLASVVEGRATMVAPDVTVVQVGGGGEAAPSTVLVQATPPEGMALTAASKAGRLSVVLPGPGTALRRELSGQVPR